MNQTLPVGCACCSVSRRRFLAACGACAASAAGWTALAPRRAAADDAPRKPKVRLLFSFIPSDRPTWPNIGYDHDGRMAHLTETLRRQCPGVEFLPAVAHNAEEAKKILEADAEVDGYLCYATGIWTRVLATIAATDRPTLMVDDLYGGSGEFLIEFARAKRAGRKVSGVSSSSLDDVAAAAAQFALLTTPGKTADDFVAACDQLRRQRTAAPGDLACKEDAVSACDVGECLKRLKEAVILQVGGGWPGGGGQRIAEIFGTKVETPKFEELHALYLESDPQQAAEQADKWIAAAEKVIEPTRDEIINSAKMHLAMRRLMEKYRAEAITINCLGGFYGGHLKAYPCLGFCAMNDGELVGACEGDLNSTITMLAMRYLINRPGFISDPVIDTSKRQIIYAQCVAPSRVFGPEGSRNPVHIRNHSEDRQGAAIRSLMPLGYMTTTIEFYPMLRELSIHRGKTVANIDEDKACRTKLAAEPVGDMEKLLGQWDRVSWHRVTFYGDVAEPVAELCKALGVTVVEEA